jgi:hypothetical protein
MMAANAFSFGTARTLLLWRRRRYVRPIAQGIADQTDEILQAANVAQALDDERAGQPTKEVFSEGQGDLKEWWLAMGGEVGPHVLVKMAVCHDGCGRVPSRQRQRVVRMRTSS